MQYKQQMGLNKLGRNSTANTAVGGLGVCGVSWHQQNLSIARALQHVVTD
jgi:hypothetical protein